MNEPLDNSLWEQLKGQKKQLHDKKTATQVYDGLTKQLDQDLSLVEEDQQLSYKKVFAQFVNYH